MCIWSLWASHRLLHAQVLGNFSVDSKQLSCVRKFVHMYKLTQKLKAEQMQLSSNRWTLQAGMSSSWGWQLTFPSSFLQSFSQFYKFCRHNSDDLNSMCCISKLSTSIHSKRDRSNGVVVRSINSGLMRYENMGPWIWKSWPRLANSPLSASTYFWSSYLLTVNRFEWAFTFGKYL